MSSEQHLLRQQLKKLLKEGKSPEKIEEMFDDLLAENEQVTNQIRLLEFAIRNDYDSILITELNLDKPGPKIVYVNEGFTRMTGYKKEEVIGKTPRILQGPKTDPAILQRLKRRLIEGQAFFGHTINYRKDGSEFINQWDIHPLINDEGQVTHWVSYQRDVTEKKEMAKAIFNTDFDELLKRREEFTIKFEKAEVDGEFRVKFLTDSFEEITGQSKNVVFDSGLKAVLHTEDVATVEAALKAAFDGKGSTEICRYKTSTDEYVSMLQSFKPIVDEKNGKVKTVKSVVKIELKES